jgi:hypothetical protein
MCLDISLKPLTNGVQVALNKRTERIWNDPRYIRYAVDQHHCIGIKYIHIHIVYSHMIAANSNHLIIAVPFCNPPPMLQTDSIQR